MNDFRVWKRFRMITKEDLKHLLDSLEAEKLYNSIWEYIEWALMNKKDPAIMNNLEEYCNYLYGLE